MAESGVSWLYHQGQTKPVEQAHYSPLDQGLLFGVGLFATFRTVGGQPLRLALHRARLFDGAMRLAIQPRKGSLVHPSTPDEQWHKTIRKLLDHHNLADGVFRLVLSAGECGAGLTDQPYEHPVESMTVRPIPPPLPAEGINLHLLRQPHPTAETLPRIKTLAYLGNALAWRELAAMRQQVTDEGLLANSNGHWIEGITSNLFALYEGRLITPPLSEGPLDGVMREAILSHGRQQGWPMTETSVTTDTLVDAEALFMSNAVRGLIPVNRLIDTGGRIRWQTPEQNHPFLKQLLDSLSIPQVH
jgi:branched-subunit amino acid aminotransferase/4-amino-4-deoxychorismate lyase